MCASRFQPMAMGGSLRNLAHIESTPVRRTNERDHAHAHARPHLHAHACVTASQRPIASIWWPLEESQQSRSTLHLTPHSCQATRTGDEKEKRHSILPRLDLIHQPRRAVLGGRAKSRKKEWERGKKRKKGWRAVTILPRPERRTWALAALPAVELQPPSERGSNPTSHHHHHHHRHHRDQTRHHTQDEPSQSTARTRRL